MMVAEMALSKVDNKTKVETTLEEEAAIRQENKEREMERLADAAEKAAKVKSSHIMTSFMTLQSKVSVPLYLADVTLLLFKWQDCCEDFVQEQK